MPSIWDVFHSDRLEAERGLTAEQVRRGLAEGRITRDDLVHPAGVPSPWRPISDAPEFADDEPAPPLMAEFAADDEPDAPLMAEFVEEDPGPAADAAPPDLLPPVPPDPVPHWEGVPYFEGDDLPDPLEEDEEAAEFTFTRDKAETIEELDLAAMVDVAFQLVLFFLVTAQTVLYKSLELPRPSDESRPEAAVQGRAKSLDDLKSNYILVEIDSAGGIKLDNEPLPAGVTLESLSDRLRAARKDTDRSAMLLSADFSTPHRNVVLAYNAANEISLKIVIAKPTGAPSDAPGEIPPPVKRPAAGF